VDNDFTSPRTYSPPPVITGCGGHELFPLTAGETRRLFSLHTRSDSQAGHQWWSLWCRRHQARARKCHYQRRHSFNNTLRL
jgi:hypothetical protein